LVSETLWPVIKAAGIPNDGINQVVYEGGGTVFAGVVLNGGAEYMPAAASLDRKMVLLARHAYWKHVGPSHLLPTTGASMTKAIEAGGLRTGWPMVEVYGHGRATRANLKQRRSLQSTDENKGCAGISGSLQSFVIAVPRSKRHVSVFHPLTPSKKNSIGVRSPRD